MLFVFTLSHGQSQVERCFSNNADKMVENLHNDSLIAQRVVYDDMKSKGLHPSEIEIAQKIHCSSIAANSKS